MSASCLYARWSKAVSSSIESAELKGRIVGDSIGAIILQAGNTVVATHQLHSSSIAPINRPQSLYCGRQGEFACSR